MEQRPLRLGDIVDDYCPRERRLTNHAIVAIVEQTVKQTRCTTCDHEHVFKNAREPRKRKKDEPAALYAQVLSGLQKDAGHVADAQHADAVADGANDAVMAEADDMQDEPADVAAQAEPNGDGAQAGAHASSNGDEAASQGDEEAQPEEDAQPGNEAEPGNEIWPMHRRLIRAQLPRTGNEPPPARPLPEFTIRQPGSRNGGRQWGRGGGGNPNGNGNGNGNHAGRGGQGAGGGGGQRPGRGGRFAPPRPDGPRGGPGGRPGGGRGRRSR